MRFKVIGSGSRRFEKGMLRSFQAEDNCKPLALHMNQTNGLHPHNQSKAISMFSESAAFICAVRGDAR
jgi:hypothetical protein